MPNVNYTITADGKDAASEFRNTDATIAKTSEGANKLSKSLDDVGAKARTAMRNTAAASRDAAGAINDLVRKAGTLQYHGSANRAQVMRNLIGGVQPGEFQAVARSSTQAATARAARTILQAQQAALRQAILGDASGASAADAVEQVTLFRGRSSARAADQKRRISLFARRHGLDVGDEVGFATARRIFVSDQRAKREAVRVVRQFASHDEMQDAIGAGIDITRPSQVAKHRAVVAGRVAADADEQTAKTRLDRTIEDGRPQSRL